MDENEKIIATINEHLNLQSKLNESLQLQHRLTEKTDELAKRVYKLTDLIDGYPAQSIQMLNTLKDKISGEEGLRVESRRHFTELKVLVRNWHLMASAMISAILILSKVYL